MGCWCIPACTGQGGCVSQHALGREVCIPACTEQGVCVLGMYWAGGMCIPACTGQAGVYPSMHWAGGVYPSMYWAGWCGRHPTGQTPRHPQQPLQRTVRILLECILVFIQVFMCLPHDSNVYRSIVKFHVL